MNSSCTRSERRLPEAYIIMLCLHILDLWPFQSSSIDSQPSPAFPSPVSGAPSSSESLLSFSTPTNLSLISPSTGATRSAKARLTAGLVLVSYKRGMFSFKYRIRWLSPTYPNLHSAFAACHSESETYFLIRCKDCGKNLANLQIT
jgi:hypothetical protein